MKTREILKQVGLSDIEVSVYISLLKLGGSLASAIAKDTGMKRTTVYPILQSLAKKAFVKVYFRNNTRYYYPQKPAKVLQLFEQKVHSFENIIPLLETVEKKGASDFGLRYIETPRELEHFYEEILSEYAGRPYSIIGSSLAWEGIDPAFFSEYRKRRAQQKIQTRLLLSAESKAHSPNEPSLLRTVKFLPEKYVFKSTIDVFDDKILVVSPDLSSLAVVIVVPAMVDVFLAVFEMLWEMTE